MLGVAFVYLGIIAAFVGAVSLLKPLSTLGIRTRRRAAFIVALGVLFAAVGGTLPARERQVATIQTQLDQFMPVFQFNEFHSIRVRAPREQIYSAIKSVTANEIFLFRTLTWVRRFGRAGPESILNAPERQPLLDVATKTSFITLAEDPNREIVVGTLVGVPRGWRPGARLTPDDFKAFRRPGFALASMNFVVEDCHPDGCMVTTETRVYATDLSSRRRFAGYWRVIYPGSALTRRMWLRAIAQRAEQRS